MRYGTAGEIYACWLFGQIRGLTPPARGPVQWPAQGLAVSLRPADGPVTILVICHCPPCAGDPRSMTAETTTTFLELYVFVLAGFVGRSRAPKALGTAFQEG